MPETADNQAVEDLRQTQRRAVNLCLHELGAAVTHDKIRELRGLLVRINVYRKDIKDSKGAYELTDLDRTFAKELSTGVLPALGDTVYATVPIPGELSGADNGLAMALMNEINWIYENEKALCGNKLSGTAKTDLATKLSDAAKEYHRRQKDLMDSGERPDLGNLSVDQLRLDVLIWFIEMLGSEAALKSIRTQAFATARAAIDATRRTVDNYIKVRGAGDQVDLAAVLNNVEELIDLTNRIIEEDNRTRREEEGIILTLGEKSIKGLVDSLGMAILAVFQEMEARHEEGTLTTKSFEKHLLKAERIHSFCGMLDNAFGQKVFPAIKKAISEKTRDLVVKLTDVNSASDPKDAQLKLRLVEDFLVTMTKG